MSRRNVRQLLAATAAVAPLCAACSSSTDPSRNSGVKALTASEGVNVAGAIFAQALGSITTGGSVQTRGVSFSRSGLAFTPHAQAPFKDVSNAAIDGKCQLGGTITGSFSTTSTLDSTGAGSVSGTISFVPHGCVVSTGTRNVTVDGDPSLTTTFTTAFAAGYKQATGNGKVSGGFKWEGGGCQMNYTENMTADGKITVSGSVCGQDVSGTYAPGGTS